MTATQAKRTLLVVGPGAHFGAEIALHFASQGFAVGVISRTQPSLDRVRRVLLRYNVRCVAVRADVTDAAGVRVAIAEISTALSPIDCLIYNVKAAVPGSGLDLEPAALTHALAVNVSGALATIQAALPWMQSPGTIILTGGGYKDRPDPNKLALSVSKAALHSVFLSLALPLSRQGVQLKSVIVDGAVRRTGPLYSTDVANSFWRAYVTPRRRAFWVPERRHARDDRQLQLLPAPAGSLAASNRN
jgi:NAD(P)-dependent dehydrogenase (short-subunit alcohol dehydrogenase family)